MNIDKVNSNNYSLQVEINGLIEMEKITRKLSIKPIPERGRVNPTKLRLISIDTTPQPSRLKSASSIKEQTKTTSKPKRGDSALKTKAIDSPIQKDTTNKGKGYGFGSASPRFRVKKTLLRNQSEKHTLRNTDVAVTPIS
jgi:hypothetical protein